MCHPLAGQMIRLLKPMTVVVRSGSARGTLSSLPKGEVLIVKAAASQHEGMLLAIWLDKEVLLFEKDLQNNLRAEAVSRVHRRA